MSKLWLCVSVTTLLQLLEFGSSRRELAVTPPLPILPLPTYSQLKWQQRELIMFLHFGVNTFTGSEWGTGRENPSVFDPSRLDPAQWIRTAAEAGFSLVILTAKHHDGFCLWPSRYTDHSVKASAWRRGGGDVVGEFVGAAEAAGVDAGLYLSPWDRHDRRYGRDEEYNEFYLAQLRELLTKYGSVREIWFDGAKGSNAPNMSYYFWDWFAMVRELQGSINIFSDAGPDVRWVGNEHGFAGTTCWSTINRTSLSIGEEGIVDYLNKGDPRGKDWVPAECDVSIRPGWFWHKSQKPKELSKLLKIYYNSVGRNCVLLINVPPNSTGLISQVDVQRLKEFKSAIDTIFSTNVAEACIIKASSQRGGKDSDFGPQNVVDGDHLWTYWAPSDSDRDKDSAAGIGEGGGDQHHWIEMRARDGNGLRFNVLRVQEPIGLGQRIRRHEVYVDGKRVVSGSTVGYKRLHRIEMGGGGAGAAAAEARPQRVRILIKESRGVPLISSVGLHFDPYWHPKPGRG